MQEPQASKFHIHGSDPRQLSGRFVLKITPRSNTGKLSDERSDQSEQHQWQQGR